jgi:hypothetical protein
MRVAKIVFFVFIVLVAATGHAQRIATYQVQLPAATNGISVPVSVELDTLTFLTDSSLTLVEVAGSKTTPVPFQVQHGDHRVLTWAISNPGTAKKRTYQLIRGVNTNTNQVAASNNNGALTIQSGGKELVRYHFGTVYPPAGIDTNYKRSGFIHPLWTPHGQELTRIQAPDHYHHYGIWNPWTHVLFEQDTVDFWNIKGRQGTVRFGGFASITNGPVFSEYETLHEHVVFHKDGTEKVALNELQTVRVYKPESNNDYYIMDVTSKLSCASESPFKILAYRYAGLGWRTTGFWDNKNCEVLGSEGTTRKNTDGAKARWCIVQGALPDNEYGGAAVLSYPGNYNHPEPMRIWVENTNGRGDMFFNFAPTKDRDWLLVPGKTYVLKYRFVVFSGKFSKEKAESAWKYFAKPARVVVGR